MQENRTKCSYSKRWIEVTHHNIVVKQYKQTKLTFDLMGTLIIELPTFLFRAEAIQKISIIKQHYLCNIKHRNVTPNSINSVWWLVNFSWKNSTLLGYVFNNVSLQTVPYKSIERKVWLVILYTLENIVLQLLFINTTFLYFKYKIKSCCTGIE